MQNESTRIRDKQAALLLIMFLLQLQQYFQRFTCNIFESLFITLDTTRINK